MMASLLCLITFIVAVCASPLPEAQPQGFETMGRLSSELSKRQFDYDITRNELGECKPVTVIFARGTVELGNVGSITGPPFFNALDVLLGPQNVAVQGVDYPATILGYLEGGDKGGAQTLADLTEQAASQCPNTQIVLSGYSQGSQVVHLGEAEISAETAARIAAVVGSQSIQNRGTTVDNHHRYCSVIPKRVKPCPTSILAKSRLSVS